MLIITAQVCCDYALNMAIPKHNPGVEDEMGTMTTAEVGVNMFSVFMSGDKSLSVGIKTMDIDKSPDRIMQELQYAKK